MRCDDRGMLRVAASFQYPANMGFSRAVRISETASDRGHRNRRHHAVDGRRLIQSAVASIAVTRLSVALGVSGFALIAEWRTDGTRIGLACGVSIESVQNCALLSHGV